MTTAGFRDVLAIGRERHADVYDVNLQVPEPLVPRRLRFELKERTDATGAVLTPPDHDAVRDLIVRLTKQNGVRSLAISFLHSYANPANEEAVGEIVGREAPELFLSLSSAVAAEIREFERTSTVVVNAYVQPVMRDYLLRMQCARTSKPRIRRDAVRHALERRRHDQRNSRGPPRASSGIGPRRGSGGGRSLWSEVGRRVACF